jgi:hypothetical protein
VHHGAQPQAVEPPRRRGVVTLPAVAEPPAEAEEPAAPARRRRRFRIWRLTFVGLTGLAVVPSILPVTPSSDENRVCVPVVDGWHADRQPPPQADFDELAAVVQDIPTPEAMRDPNVRAAYAAAVKAQLASPAYRRVQAYIEWSTGSGACVPESRHRLIQTGLGLGGIAGAAVIATVTDRRRRKRGC